MTENRNFTKLSKFLALILRHQPERFGLLLDERGWVSLAEAMEILASLPNYHWANRSDVRQIVGSGAGDLKRRFELADGRIRACYGHSFDSPRIQYDPCSLPWQQGIGRSFLQTRQKNQRGSALICVP